MPDTPEPKKLELARFTAFAPPSKKKLVDVSVHFNPASLQYTVSNPLKEEGQGSKKKQHVSQTTAKLSMQLVFDTTNDGTDVRIRTDEMAKLLKEIEGKDKFVPPTVEFEWGAYRFTGMVEQYKETMDFFADDGLPLRSTIDLTLASQEVVFERAINKKPKGDGDPTIQEPVVVPSPGGGPAGVANALGDPRGARAIAALNGSASLRFDASPELAVGGGVTLAPAAAFSLGAGVGISGGIGGGVGFGAGAGAGIGIGAAAGAGIGFGGGAIAGVGFGAGAAIGVGATAGFSAGASASAAGGAFSGLRAAASVSGASLDGRALFGATTSVSTGSGTEFGLGGQSQAQAGASLGVDVGANADLHARIRFD